MRLLVVEMGSVARGFSATPDGERPGSPDHADDGAEQECQRDRSSRPPWLRAQFRKFWAAPKSDH